MRRSESGFSFIEVMISAGILVLLISMAMRHISREESSADELDKRMKARHIMDRSISRLVAELRSFPTLSMAGTSTAMSYVGCFDEGGAIVASTLKTSEFVAYHLPDPRQTSKICGKAQFEAHVVPSLEKFKSATVYLLSFDFQKQEHSLIFTSELILQGSI